MKLWLLRHGEAEPRLQDHPERVLTARGQQEAAETACQLLGQPIDLMLVSPYRRAQQTAEQVCRVVEYQGPKIVADWALPESSPLEAVRHLDAYPQANLLLVTHQNFVGALASLLIEGETRHGLPFHTGSLACLEGEAIAAGLMHLGLFYHPGRL